MSYSVLQKASKKQLNQMVNNPEIAGWIAKNIKNDSWQTWFARNVKKDPSLFNEKNKETLIHYNGMAGTLDEVGKVSLGKHHDFEAGLKEMKDAETAGQERHSKSKHLLEPTENTEKMIDLGNGWGWYNLNTNQCGSEGSAMGHCGNEGERSSDDNVLSLRKEHKVGDKTFHEPKLTFIANQGYLGEMKGKNNDKPHPKYHGAIKELLKHEDIKGIVGGGYLPENNFDFHDLDESSRKEITDLKPKIDRSRIPEKIDDYDTEGWDDALEESRSEYGNKKIDDYLDEKEEEHNKKIEEYREDYINSYIENLKEDEDFDPEDFDEENERSIASDSFDDDKEELYPFDRDSHYDDALEAASDDWWNKGRGDILNEVDGVISHNKKIDKYHEEFKSKLDEGEDKINLVSNDSGLMGNKFVQNHFNKDDLMKMVKHPDKDVAEAAIKHPNADKEILMHGINHPNEDVANAAVSHKNADKDVLMAGINHPDFNVARNAVSHDNADKDVLMHGVNHPSEDVASAAVRHKNADKDVLMHGVNHPDKDVAWNAVKHKNADKEILMHGVKHPDKDVARNAVRHKNTDKEILMHGVNHPDFYVANAAVSHDNADKEILMHGINHPNEDVAWNAVRHKNADKEILMHGINHPDFYVARAAVSHDNADKEILMHGINHPNEDVARAAVSHDNADKEILMHGINHPDESVAWNAVRHKNADKDVLIHGIKHSDESVADISKEKLQNIDLKKSIPENTLIMYSDGDNAGSQVEKAVMRDDLDSIKEISKRINEIGVILNKTVNNIGGEVINHGGDDFCAVIPINHSKELTFAKNEIKNKTGFSVTIGIGQTSPKAIHALLWGKLHGKDRIVYWDEDVEKEINELRQPRESEAEKTKRLLDESDIFK